MTRIRRAAALLALSLLPTAGAAPLTVFAASSLTDALTELGAAYTKQTGQKVVFQFAGSQALRAQLEAGARADVFASASAAQYEPLVKAGLAGPGTIFARNRLTIIAPRNNPRVRTLADLTAPGVRLVVADAAVPVGDLTRKLFAAVSASGTYGRDYGARALKNVVSEEPNVRQVALKVSLGEADAAVVYRSDLTPTLRQSVREIALPSRFNQTGSYPAGVLRGADPGGATFVAFLRSAPAQAALRRWGFLSP